MKGRQTHVDRSGRVRTVSVRLSPDPALHGWDRHRAVLALSAYLLFTGVVAWIWAVTPALALVSSTGYVRVVPQTAQLAYLGANRAALISTVAQAAVASPASLAMRLVAGPLGWASLGVTAGLVLAQMYYSKPDLQAIAQAAAPPNGTWSYTYNGQTYTVPTNQFAGSPTSTSSCPGGMAFGFPGTAPPGMSSFGPANWYCAPSVPQPGTNPATQSDVQQYLTSQPTSSAVAPEQHLSPVGASSTPQPADSTTSTAVSPTDLPTTVKPASQVLPTDAVVDPNAPKPSGTDSVPASQTTTTTTTTTTNPDGSKTDTTQDTANVSCTSGDHDSRSFGSVLQSHIDTWKGSGLLSALSLLQTLTWPDQLPTITVSSTTWGTHQVDFNQWAAVFTALRTLIIAGAGFAAYRIIFVGGS